MSIKKRYVCIREYQSFYDSNSKTKDIFFNAYLGLRRWLKCPPRLKSPRFKRKRDAEDWLYETKVPKYLGYKLLGSIVYFKRVK